MSMSHENIKKTSHDEGDKDGGLSLTNGGIMGQDDQTLMEDNGRTFEDT